MEFDADSGLFANTFFYLVCLTEQINCSKPEIEQSSGWHKIVRSNEATYSIYDNGEELLFDLENDPHQLRNVAQDSSAKDLLDQMRVRLLKKTIEARDPLPERIRPY